MIKGYPVKLDYKWRTKTKKSHPKRYLSDHKSEIDARTYSITAPLTALLHPLVDKLKGTGGRVTQMFSDFHINDRKSLRRVTALMEKSPKIQHSVYEPRSEYRGWRKAVHFEIEEKKKFNTI